MPQRYKSLALSPQRADTAIPSHLITQNTHRGPQLRSGRRMAKKRTTSSTKKGYMLQPDGTLFLIFWSTIINPLE